MKNIFSILILLIFVSCGRDHFNQVLEIDLPEEPSVLAVTTQIKNGDEILKTLVSQTKGILDNSEFPTFPEANVQLFENGNLLGAFEYEDPTQSHVNVLDFPINGAAGTVYRMEVAVPDADLEPVFAEQIMPTAVPITEVTYEALGANNFEGDDQDELIIKFKDEPNEENFYNFEAVWWISFRVEGDTTVHTFSQDLYLDTLDPLIEYGADGAMMLNDRTFEGDTYSLRFFFYPLQNFLEGEDVEVVSNEINVNMGSMTNDTYLYLKTLEAFRSNRDNPFSEPVTVHHNFEGGTGVFGLENGSEFVLDIGE